MGTFNQKKKFGGRSFGGGKKSFGDKREPGAPSAMHKATCHKCGKDCEVPFRPTGSRPIFCSICFDKQGPERPRFQDKRKHEFERDNAIEENKSAEQQKAQFAQLHAKMDKILQILDTYFASQASSKKSENDSDEPVEKPPFKMKKKVVGTKKAAKKK